jgi:hypothetical protein
MNTCELLLTGSVYLAYTVFVSQQTGKTKQMSKTFQEIANEYRPYNQMIEFQMGCEAYMDRKYDNPFTSPEDGIKAQAWDRGANATMWFTRQSGGY